MCSCKENIENKSPCKCQDKDYEMGGSIDSERRFSESDYNRLIESTLFKGRWTGFVWEIYPFNGGNVLGKFNPKTKTLFIASKKDKSNILVEWLQNNSYVSMEEYQKLKDGGIPSKNWDKYEDGGAVVGGFSLVYQKWSDIMGGNGVSGTIRTTPANYYVATIDEKGEIIFDYIEAMTRDIDVAKVRKLWENNLIPEEKKRYYNGGKIGKYKIGDFFEESPTATYDYDWQLYKPSTSYIIDNKTKKIVSIHNTPYEAIKERDEKYPYFKVHYEINSEKQKSMMSNGGTTQNLEKELKRLQRELNSHRLSTYMEGDYSEDEMARRREREVKLARFNEILKLLNENDDKYLNGGSIGFIPMDLEEKLAITAKWGGTNIKGVIGFLNAMIDSGVTDEDLIAKPTKNTRFQRERAEEKKIQEIWNRIEPNYKGGLKGNMYYSTIKRLVQRASAGDNILKEYKPFRKYQKDNYAKGGGVEYSSEISKQQLESMVGRSLNGWNDDVVYYEGNVYKKCFLRPYYKKQ